MSTGLYVIKNEAGNELFRGTADEVLKHLRKHFGGIQEAGKRRIEVKPISIVDNTRLAADLIKEIHAHSGEPAPGSPVLVLVRGEETYRTVDAVTNVEIDGYRSVIILTGDGPAPPEPTQDAIEETLQLYDVVNKLSDAMKRSPVGTATAVLAIEAEPSGDFDNTGLPVTNITLDEDDNGAIVYVHVDGLEQKPREFPLDLDEHVVQMMVRPPVKWREFVSTLSGPDRMELSRGLAHLCAALSRAEGYVSQVEQKGYNINDNTHAEAVKKANKRYEKVRKALGYTYAAQPINF